jgi:hypothetical protein
MVGHWVSDILITFCINNWQCEPHQQYQNQLKDDTRPLRNTNQILDCSGALAHMWLLCLQYVCFLLNQMYKPSLILYH